MSFTHLHVTTAFTPGVGTAAPAELARAAAQDGATALACTDRDGLHGAVQHVLACQAHGLTPVLGVDLAVLDVEEDGARRRATGRVVVLAQGGGKAPPGAGYRALCRLVAEAHARSSGRSQGTTAVGVTRQELAARAVDPDSGLPVLTVLLGPESDVGLAMHGPRYLRPRTLFKEWLAAMPTGTIAGEVVSHQAAPGLPFTTSHAARMLKLAREHHVPAILSNAVRHSGPDGAQDPARPGGTQAYLKSHRDMEQTAREVGHAADLRVKDLTQLLRDTEELADLCRLDPVRDLAWGQWLLPESPVLGLSQAPHAELTARCQDAFGQRFATRTDDERRRLRERLEHELTVTEACGAATFFLSAAEVTQTINDSGVRAVARGGMTASLIAHLLGITGVNPLEHESPFEPCLPASASADGLPPLGSFPGLELDLESGRLREVHRAVARRFGKGRVGLLNSVHRAAVTEMEGVSEAVSESLVEDACLAGEPPAASRRSAGLVIGDASLLHRIPTQAGESGLPLSQLAPEDLSSWGVLRVTLRETATQTLLARALRELERQSDAGGVNGDGAREAIQGAAHLPDSADGPWRGPAGPPHSASTDAAEDLSVRQTAWLRSHHPGAYLAALWDTPGDAIPPRLLRAEAGLLGVRVLPVDVNLSAEECRVERNDGGAGLRLGLHEVPGISASERKRLVSGRPYRSVDDLLARGAVSSGTVRKLAEAGVLDSLPGEDGRDASSALVRTLREWAARPTGSPRPQVEGQLALPLDVPPGTTAGVVPPERAEDGHGFDSTPAELTVVSGGSAVSRARTPARSEFPPRISHRPDPARRTGSG